MAQVESFGPNFSTFKDVLRRLEAEGKDIEVTTLQDMYDATYNYKSFGQNLQVVECLMRHEIYKKVL